MQTSWSMRICKSPKGSWRFQNAPLIEKIAAVTKFQLNYTNTMLKKLNNYTLDFLHRAAVEPKLAPQVQHINCPIVGS